MTNNLQVQYYLQKLIKTKTE